MRLEIGQTYILKLSPSLKWQNTQVEIASDEKYEFNSDGWWVDFFIPTDADGFSNKWFMPKDDKKRVPSCNWLALMGTLQEIDSTSFLIGKHLEKEFKNQSGFLRVFANDMRSGGFFLANNWGNMKLTIKRIQ